MTTALDTKLTQPGQSLVFSYAGQFWNLGTMPSENIKWLQEQMGYNPTGYEKNLLACQAELERRIPDPTKLHIIQNLEKYSATLLEKFMGVLASDKLVLSDLAMNSGSKKGLTSFGEGLQLALDGRWELPGCLGWGFKVDSIPGQYGCLKYEVKCRSSQYHNYNHCKCDDFLYHSAGKISGYCKHVCCVWFVCEAQKL